MKRLIRVVAIMLVSISILSVCMPAFAVTNLAVNSIALVQNKQGNARLRSKADKNSAMVRDDTGNDIILPNGEEVTILQKTTGKDKKVWYKVSVYWFGKTYVGYIRHDYLISKASVPAKPEWEKYYGTMNLKYGSVNTDAEQIALTYILNDLVKWAQNTTEDQDKIHSPQWTIYKYHKGWFDKMDGFSFNASWDAAVRRFQESIVGLSIDGIIGPKTKQALWNKTH